MMKIFNHLFTNIRHSNEENPDSPLLLCFNIRKIQVLYSVYFFMVNSILEMLE
jgi:hypothetical protein